MHDKPEITDVVNAQMPLGTTLGIRTFGDADEMTAALAWAPELCTAGGVLHGGALMALADAARRRLRLPQPPRGRPARRRSSRRRTSSRRVREGEVARASRPLHVGRTTIVVETDLFDAGGRHVARTMQTQAVLSAG